jgi:hypothetical protein
LTFRLLLQNRNTENATVNLYQVDASTRTTQQSGLCNPAMTVLSDSSLKWYDCTFTPTSVDPTIIAIVTNTGTGNNSVYVYAVAEIP